MYDFKIGLYPLIENSTFNQDNFSKIIKTLTAMANTLPKTLGYCVIGVADTVQDAQRYEEIYQCSSLQYASYAITGIQNEAKLKNGDVDKYFRKILQDIAQEPISQRDKDYISRNIRIVKYFEHEIIILQIESGDEPSIYDNNFYVRHGNSIKLVPPQEYKELFKRF